jgi:hypothetical protein
MLAAVRYPERPSIRAAASTAARTGGKVSASETPSVVTPL